MWAIHILSTPQIDEQGVTFPLLYRRLSTPTPPYSHATMSIATGAASIQLEMGGKTPQHTSCCARRRKCLRGCCCCCVCLALTLGIVAFIFWPRLLTLCVHYSRLSARLIVDSTVYTSTAQVEMTVPISIMSTNLWSFHMDLLDVTMYYSGSDVELSQGRVEDFALAAQGNTSFDVTVSPIVDVSPAQAAVVVDYFVARCGPAFSSGSWLADLKVLVELWGFRLTFWLREIELPCVAGSAVAALGAIATGGEDDCEGEGHTAGRYCKRLLCSIDDLMCEKCTPAASPSSSTSTALPPPPAAPSVGAPITLLSSPPPPPLAPGSGGSGGGGGGEPLPPQAPPSGPPSGPPPNAPGITDILAG